MFKCLILQNWQKFQGEKRIDFTPGLNVIIGKTDSGKSSIMRNILWCATNRPSGTAFRSWRIKKGEITSSILELDNGFILRERNMNGVNRYVVEDSINNVQKTFEALRTDVPEMVKSVLNMEDFQFCRQHGSHFFIDDSGGEAARKLNRLVGLQIIDNVYKKIDSIISTSKTEKNRYEAEVAENSEKLDDLKYLDEVKPIIELMESMEQKIVEVENEIEEVETAFRTLTKIQETLEELKDWLTVRERYQRIQKKVVLYKEAEKEYEDISSSFGSLHNLDRSIEVLKDWLKVSEPFDKLVVKSHRYESVDLECKELTISLAKLQSCEDSLEKQKERLIKLAEKRSSLIKKGGVCPTCGKKLTSKDLTERIHENH